MTSLGIHVVVVYGTRPEAIKVAPVIRALGTDPRFRVTTVATGQHRQILDEVGELFAIKRDADLQVFHAGQSLSDLAAAVLTNIAPVFEDLRPDLVLVQGDTSSAFAAALAAFHAGVPVVHLEAGLRSPDISHPFPEEANRRLISQIAALHLAPSGSAKCNLLDAGILAENIVVTGNTVVDALQEILTNPPPWNNAAVAQIVESGAPVVTLTAHRRENWGRPLVNIARACARLSARFTEVHFVLPLHPNPVVRAVFDEHLGGRGNVHLVPPLRYGDFLRLVSASVCVVSDSGGVQEEVPTLRTPLFILRESTERPEVLESGWARIVGTDEGVICDAVSSFLLKGDTFAEGCSEGNPFGDGRASQRAVEAIARFSRV